MVHFESMQKAIKLNWVKRLINMSSNCAVLADTQTNLPIPITEVFRSKLTKDHIDCKCPFYQQLLEYWFDIYSNQPDSAEDIFQQPLWFNSNIVVGRRPVFYKQWWDSSIRYISDICSLNGTIMTKVELENRFDIVVDQMTYNRIVSAVPNEWRQIIKNQSVTSNREEVYVHLNGVQKNAYNFRCRDVYKFLIAKIKKPPTAVTKWTETYNITEDEWEAIFRMPFRICIETDLQSFQYKIINRFFPCNYTLSIWYSDISDTCQYCQKESDTLVHYFVHCSDVIIFWKQFEKMWKRVFDMWF